MQAGEMRETIRELAGRELIDEIRFIDGEDLTDEHIGDSKGFIGRQPRDIMKGAKTVIITSVYIGNFVTDYDDNSGRMSRLVLSGYYANLVKPLEPIVQWLKNEGYSAEIMDGESDATLIPLKGAAVKAGLGWIGKNSMLIDRKYGSFQALGAIITDADLSECYEISRNYCGSCNVCIENCPTSAIEIPQVLTRKKCLSDMLENEEASIEAIGNADLDNYFFECDICQNACPWNRIHLSAPLDTPYGKLFDKENIDKLMALDSLLALDEAAYDEKLAPLMLGYRLPYDLFRRNISAIDGNKSL